MVAELISTGKNERDEKQTREDTPPGGGEITEATRPGLTPEQRPTTRAPERALAEPRLCRVVAPQNFYLRSGVGVHEASAAVRQAEEEEVEIA